MVSVNTPGDSHGLVTGPQRQLPPGVDQLPSGAYRARVVNPEGKQISLGTFPTMTAAGRAAQQARTDITRGSWIDPRRSAISLEEWMTEWMPNRQIREATREKDQERYRVHIKPYLGSVPLHRITPYRVETWLAQLARDGRQPATIKKAHTLLKTALGVRGAVGDQRLGSNPCLIVRPPSVGQVEWTLLTDAEIAKLIGVVEERWEPLVTVLADTGIRWSEAMGLQRQDYNPLKGTLLVQRTRDPKGQTQPTKNRRNRVVPLSTRATAALNVAVEGKDPAAWIFTAPRGGVISASNWTYRVWRAACATAGIRARVHDLRHSCASRLLAGGASVAEVRDFLGHSSITVTEVYLHTDRDGLAATVRSALG